MNPLLAAVRRAADDLNRSGRRWALVGGFAVSARVEPRFTRDVDVAIMVDSDESAERLVRSLIANGYAVFSSVEHDNGRLATARMTRAFDGNEVVIDLLFASSGIEPEIAEAAEILEIASGIRLPVATVGHLIATKILARDDQTRPQDLADLRALLAVATDREINLARESIELIEARGFNRHRDLRQALADLLADR
jgi:predicted nucleotidyltransferase